MHDEQPLMSAAVVFDLWDTLVPIPTTLRSRAVHALATALHCDPDKLGEAWMASRTQLETGDLEEVIRRLCAECGFAFDDAAIRAGVIARARILAEAFAAPRPDAIATLAELRARGLRVGLISNCTSDLPLMVASSPLAPFLDATLYSSSEGVMKPDARIYRRMAECLGVGPEDCIYVGDGSDGELAGAEAVGMTAVLLACDELPQPDWKGRHVSSLGALAALVAVGG